MSYCAKSREELLELENLEPDPHPFIRRTKIVGTISDK
jgi:hypothetical protein